MVNDAPLYLFAVLLCMLGLLGPLLVGRIQAIAYERGMHAWWFGVCALLIYGAGTYGLSIAAGVSAWFAVGMGVAGLIFCALLFPLLHAMFDERATARGEVKLSGVGARVAGVLVQGGMVLGSIGMLALFVVCSGAGSGSSDADSTSSSFGSSSSMGSSVRTGSSRSSGSRSSGSPGGFRSGK